MTSPVANPNSVKAGDTEPLQVTLSDINGPVNLAGASVVMRMKSRVPGSGHSPISASCDVLQGVDGNGRITDRGLVEYAWNPGETDTVGVYGLEFVVTFQDGTKRTFPNDRTVTFEIAATAT